MSEPVIKKLNSALSVINPLQRCHAIDLVSDEIREHIQQQSCRIVMLEEMMASARSDLIVATGMTDYQSMIRLINRAIIALQEDRDE